MIHVNCFHSEIAFPFFVKKTPTTEDNLISFEESGFC